MRCRASVSTTCEITRRKGCTCVGTARRFAAENQGVILKYSGALQRIWRPEKYFSFRHWYFHASILCNFYRLNDNRSKDI